MEIYEYGGLNDFIDETIWKEGIDGSDEALTYVKKKLSKKMLYRYRVKGKIDKKLKKKIKKIVKKKSKKLFKLS